MEYFTCVDCYLYFECKKESVCKGSCICEDFEFTGESSNFLIEYNKERLHEECAYWPV